MVRNSDGRSLIVRKSMLFTKRDLRELKTRYRSAFFNVLLSNFLQANIHAQVLSASIRVNVAILQ